MRSVGRDLCKHHINTDKRRELFLLQSACGQYAAKEWIIQHFERRFKPEREYTSYARVKFEKHLHERKVVPAHVAYQRVRAASIRAAKRMRTAQQQVNASMAPLLCYGLLKTEGKFQQVRRVNNTLLRGKGDYGISLPQLATLDKVKQLADQVYNNPDTLTNAPDWVLRYRKGRLHNIDNILARPNQQVTLTQMDHTKYSAASQVEDAINSALATTGMNAIAMRIKKGRIADKPQVAAVVYFESAYHARCALYPLATLGQVHLGQTVATARVFASKVQHTIEMLLTEADGRIAQDFDPEQLADVLSIIGLRRLPLQIWTDKDGRVTFIKIKLVDVTYHFFKKGESRVVNLLEYIGDEAECRQFIPALVDQFAATNNMTFHLLNHVPVKTPLVFISGDHKSLWAQTGREGGNVSRDLFSHHSLANMFHKVLYQGPVSFKYTDFIRIWQKITEEMSTLRTAFTTQNKHLSKKQEYEFLHKMYRIHGRIDRAPAFMNGVKAAQPTVTEQLLVTPLNLHNDSFDNLLTMDLMFQIVDSKSKELRRLLARHAGLLDGFGQKKCTQSGEGIRGLFHDCLCLEQSLIPTMSSKYSGVWWLKDAISYHLRLTGRIDYRPLALEPHERLKFAGCTLIWWLLMGDLSDQQGGRTMDSGKTKNHLEDKIYPYETAHACVEFEERHRVPLSLLNESVFEATFVFRDELIESFRSKVAIERERKADHFKQLVNVSAPSRQYRSIMSGLSRHSQRDIIILECWKSRLKWSLNIRTMLLQRCSKYDYRGRVSLCATGQHQHAIKLRIKHETDISTFHDRHIEPPVIIDPCGECCLTNVEEITFDRSLNLWFFKWRVRTLIARRALAATYYTRLRQANIKRAQRIHADLQVELKKHASRQEKRTHQEEKKKRARQQDSTDTKKNPKSNINLIYRLHKGHSQLHQRWPRHIPALQVSTQLRKIIQRVSAKQGDSEVWNGDMETILISDVQNFKVSKLKAILRFFQRLDPHAGLTLSGRKTELQKKVVALLQRYSPILNSP